MAGSYSSKRVGGVKEPSVVLLSMCIAVLLLWPEQIDQLMMPMQAIGDWSFNLARKY